MSHIVRKPKYVRENETHRKCNRCGEAKPIALFMQKCGSTGRYCQPCQAIRTSELRRARTKMKAEKEGRVYEPRKTGTRWCIGCKKDIPIEQMSRYPSTGRIAQRCQPCADEYRANPVPVPSRASPPAPLPEETLPELPWRKDLRYKGPTGKPLAVVKLKSRWQCNGRWG